MWGGLSHAAQGLYIMRAFESRAAAKACGAHGTAEFTDLLMPFAGQPLLETLQNVSRRIVVGAKIEDRARADHGRANQNGLDGIVGRVHAAGHGDVDRKCV